MTRARLHGSATGTLHADGPAWYVTLAAGDYQARVRKRPTRAAAVAMAVRYCAFVESNGPPPAVVPMRRLRPLLAQLADGDVEDGTVVRA